MVQHEQFGRGVRGAESFLDVSRRGFLVGALLGLGGMALPFRSANAWQDKAKDGETDSDVAEIARVQAIATKAGLGRFSSSSRAHFLGIGDADARFRKSALDICESLAPAFIQHFNINGFKLAMPKDRLTVITLNSAESYKALSKALKIEEPGAVVGGHYDLDANWLVMFDFRPQGEEAAAVNDPRRVNRLTLVHETTHMLCFNTGLLSRQASVPNWVSEGLATYVELWHDKRSKIGAPNLPWLACVNNAKRNGTTIPLGELLGSDKAFEEDENAAQSPSNADDTTKAQVAYGESWLLVHYLMRQQQLPKFRAYLAGLSSEEAASKRLEYAEKHFGKLDKLSNDLDRHLKRGAK